MYNKKPIADNIFYTGVNDRQKELFENYLPLPHGVAYNSYLIADEKTALVDTVDISLADVHAAKVEAILNGRNLDYLIVNHMEPDHAGAIGMMRQKYPDMQIVGNAKTFDMLKGYFRIDTGLYEVKEGSTLSLGRRNLTFYMAPMVHWPEVMMAYEATDGILFSADAFGTFGTLDGGYLDAAINTDIFWNEMRRYYACIVGKYGAPTQSILKKLAALDIRTICSTHGPVWQSEIKKAVSLYDRWSRYEAEAGVTIAYGTMYGNTQQLAEAAAEGVIDGGIRNVAVHNVSKTDMSFILADIFKYRGVIVGSPTYSGSVYPLVERLLSAIEHRGVKNRLYSCFGSFTWASAAVKELTAFAQTMGWEMAGAPIDNRQAVFADKYEEVYAMGKALAARLLL